MTKVEKSEEEWKKILTEEEYRICREKGTESPFTGEYWQCTDVTGYYQCRCCHQALFSTDTKFDSGSGWPSFYRPVSENGITEIEDDSLGMPRTEVVCSQCDSHLGHVFDDGPAPTGLRYCINSASLKFVEAE